MWFKSHRHCFSAPALRTSDNFAQYVSMGTMHPIEVPNAHKGGPEGVGDIFDLVEYLHAGEPNRTSENNSLQKSLSRFRFQKACGRLAPRPRSQIPTSFHRVPGAHAWGEWN